MLEADVVIAGSGPGGATVARELSKKGKKVILVEKGRDYKPGRIMNAYHIIGRYPTIEKDSAVVQASCLGGGSFIFLGNSEDPMFEMWNRYGIDITQDTREAKKDLRVTRVPDALVSPGIRRLHSAARELGYPCEILEKFLDPSKCRLNCNKCTYGCPTGARWSAVEFIREAENNGAAVLTGVAAQNVIAESGVAVGMRVIGQDGLEYEINGKVVVCSAGAVNTARILKRSGIDNAGNWLIGDPVVTVTGFVQEGKGELGGMQMTAGWHDKENGVLFANQLWDFPMMAATTYLSPGKLQGLRDLLRYNKAMKIMCKIADEFDGKVFPEEGKYSKVFTKQDKQRIDYSRKVAKRVLIKAGCTARSIFHSPGISLGHPGGTVRIGRVLDANLESPIKNLYCCDTSVIPESLGIPPTLTIVALAKRLSRRIAEIV